MVAKTARVISDSQLAVIAAEVASVTDSEVVAIGDVFSAEQLVRTQSVIMCPSGGNIRFSISPSLIPAADEGLCAPEAGNTPVAGPRLVNDLSFISESGTVKLTIFLMRVATP